MAESSSQPRQLYYTIKEVAAMFDVKESLLRFWEKEFPHLKPQTTGNKVRQYTEKDIEQIRLIHNLVKVRGFKLSAARKYINETRGGLDKSNELLETLISVRDQLKSLKEQLASLT